MDNNINFKYTLQSSFSGGFAGIMQDLFFFPFDSIKTRKQSINKKFGKFKFYRGIQ